MSPMPPRSRSRVASGPAVRRARKLGEIRRSQLITTYGVGAMIAVDNESFILTGLDSWDIAEAHPIWEPRLSRPLGVNHFRLPPAPEPERARDGVRAARFPVWYSCPNCGDLQRFRSFNSPMGKAECGKCQLDLVPSRFVVACPYGHIDDFPYWKWLHRSADYQRGDAASGGSCGGNLTLHAEGSTASLRSVLIGCTCGVKKVSLEGAFRSRALKDLGIRCTGRSPWLRDAPNEFCDAVPRTLQRGSSSAWNPVVHSALSIPPWSEGLYKAVAPYYDRIRDESPADIQVILRYEKFFTHHPEYTAEAVIELVERLNAAKDGPADESPVTGSPREKIYQEEFRSLNTHHPEEGSAQRQDFVCEPPRGGAEALLDLGVERVMLVKRLREVRALQSFTRVEEPSAADEPRRRAKLSREPLGWLPAIEVSGEGVFVTLDPQRLQDWEQQVGYQAAFDRAERIRTNHDGLLRSRAVDAAKPIPESPASPRFLAVHTLAHILINEWSLDGGYPAASLRERLYVGPDMAGILIYTATSDSAGSLGGIVAQGEPGRLRQTLRSALDRARWCSNDPLCMEAEAAGTDSLNLAACHACVLLPETSCEVNNTILDRAALVGTQDGSVPGFFGPW
ncbi:DUF1998 domain-containing protein [Streptacidiphilus albus]|uniref:DUF1998 domain-containing protein n=1 Tax=Streptacidiphilus albus TaxID=105425 RepID=UPI00054C74E7|nr:DUF1998 domain-containing protein [Streptacidiphilus albus]